MPYALCHHPRMLINAPCVVTLSWRLADAQNRPIDELAQPAEFFYGGDELLDKVEEALLGRSAGDELHVHLEPEHAFGEYRSELVCFEDRHLFPETLEEGMTFEGLPAGSRTPGMPQDAVYVVTEIYPGHVVLDGNHPLAGLALHLALKVHDVRDASSEEIEARTAGETASPMLANVALH